MSWILIRFCVATVLWQLGGADPLFLNSGKGKTLLRLTTPPATDSGSVSLPEKALVLNPRGRSVRVRLPRKSDKGVEEGRFSQFPVVAPLNHMQAPPGGDQALVPVSRQGRQSNFALNRQNQAPFLNNPPNRNNFLNRPRGQRQFNRFNQNQGFRNANQGNSFESNRQSLSNFNRNNNFNNNRNNIFNSNSNNNNNNFNSNNNFSPPAFQLSTFTNSEDFQSVSPEPSPVTSAPVEVSSTTTTTVSPPSTSTSTSPPVVTSASTSAVPLRTSGFPQETRQPRILSPSVSPSPVFSSQSERQGRTGQETAPATFRPSPSFSTQRERQGRTGHQTGGYYAPPKPVYKPPTQYGQRPFYKILKMTGLDTAPIPTFNYMYSTENKINVMGQGELKTICDEEVSVMRGSYDYYGTDGKKYTVDWYADETGFHPSAEHLPKSVEPNHPEVAAAVAAQLKYAASHHRARRASQGYSAPYQPCPPPQPKYVPAKPTYNPPPPSYSPSL